MSFLVIVFSYYGCQKTEIVDLVSSSEAEIITSPVLSLEGSGSSVTAMEVTNVNFGMAETQENMIGNNGLLT